MEIEKKLFDLLVLSHLDEDHSHDGEIQEMLMDILRVHGCTDDKALMEYIQKARLRVKS